MTYKIKATLVVVRIWFIQLNDSPTTFFDYCSKLTTTKNLDRFYFEFVIYSFFIQRQEILALFNHEYEKLIYPDFPKR